MTQASGKFDFIVLFSGILLISTSGIFGRVMTLPPATTIWARCVIGCVILFVLLKLQKKDTRFMKGREGRNVVISSIFLWGHWTTYFAALLYSNIALGMLSLFTYPLITAIIEPFFLKTKFQLRHIPLGIIGFLGIFLLVPEFSITNKDFLGILFGVLSAFIYTFRNLFLKLNKTPMHGGVLMMHQLFIVSIVFWPGYFLIAERPQLLLENLQPLLGLAIITTAMGHTLVVMSIIRFSATSFSMFSNLTPLVGIILGFVFLGEIPQGNVYIGGSLILLTALIEGFYHYRST